MTELLLATNNGGKAREIQTILHHLGIEDIKILTLSDVHLSGFAVEETGHTYEDNATLKAKTLADKTRHLTIADDSGIEVTALGHKPGVYSARYAKGSDTDRCHKLLKELEGKEDRSAKFVCVIVYIDPHGNERHVFHGECKGLIAPALQGTHGFGYDPLFVPEGYHQTMAELGSDVKDQISHRAKALQAFATWWKGHKKVHET
ncbi:non-canonical purine NTP pyrophosphatase, RdgB/HAM1 family [Candidatus Cerribacteria bacterium 'Amazon FNV 2010 28 9']|uniref:dITP/XTP pyrophosphatase n=1 Tax=Candidatus Cerribacteria bacterium 'Amazon FNV 2010 28 9' TaxID=2081795 RepID=A0A317JS46_9BACT|nr:MAG: non-canonical purine NTP pyrophosphatase, RdgB/HAM1 family [Candidatus Cerribacteria bacterium 'Amazon FNV 2010 28 9']